MEDKKFVLIVIFDDETRNVLTDAFQEHDCPFANEMASTIKDALEVISQKVVHAIVMTKIEALSGDNGANGLISYQKDLPPTITLINPGDGYPDYLYDQKATNDWVTVPFDIHELYQRVLSIIQKTNK